MTKIFLAGLVNTETTVAVPKFPIPYEPVHYNYNGIGTTVSGAGWNVAKALKTLGNEISFAGFIGNDVPAQSIKKELESIGISNEGLLPELEGTPQSVILYDREGRRSIQTDLKNIQDQSYPLEIAEGVLQDCDAAVLCNINFSRPLLDAAKKLNKPIITDVHAIDSFEDDYNQDYINKSDILFFSHEKIRSNDLNSFIEQIVFKTKKLAVVGGMGKEGAMLWDHIDQKIVQIPCIRQNRIKSSVGAGDALMASFTHFYLKNYGAGKSLDLAQKFAAHKIQFAGGAEGFLDEQSLLNQ